MRRLIITRVAVLLASLLTFVASSFAADLKPDDSTSIPESAKRPTVVIASPSQISDFKSQIPATLLPEGMELTVAAASPLVTHPIMGCVDDRGRLFIGDATGVNWNKAQLEQNPPNRVLLLEDTDKDGVFDKSTIFADKMTFPQGACWLNGSLYVCSPPGLWKLTDTNHDGIADEREMIVGGFEYTGNAADVHGPFLHPNGRLYWCHGRKGHEVKQKDGAPVHQGTASGIWSCLPDGADIQWHSLGCGDNPVEVDFTPSGDIIGVQNLYYSQPRGDTVVHWLYGGVYERADLMKAIEGLPRTSEHMPVMYNFGHVAVSGCCFARNPAWTADMSTPQESNSTRPLNFFVTHFNTQRVVRMELTPEGATYKATEHEFLKLPSSPDVHFTDVMEDTDGSLLTLNTGGWFRIGCPSSLMAKPDIAGAVYRIKKKGSSALPLATKPVPPTSRSISAWITDLGSPDAHIQLQACTALASQSKGDENVHQALLELLKQPMDPVLEHAAIFACARNGLDVPQPRNEANPDFVRRMLIVGAANRKNPAASQVALNNALQRLDTPDEKLASAAAWVVTNTILGPKIASESVTKETTEWLKKPELSNRQIEALRRLSTDLITQEPVKTLVGLMLSHPHAPVRTAALHVIATQSAGIVNAAWLPPIEKSLREASPGDLPLILDAIKKLKTDQFNTALQGLADDTKQPLPLRLKALDAMKGGKMTPITFAMLQDVLMGTQASAAARIQSATMLASAAVDAKQIQTLAPVFATSGPVELKELLPLIRKTKEEPLLNALASSLAKNPAISSIEESMYRTAFADKPTSFFEGIVLPALRKANATTEAKKRVLPALAETALKEGRPEEGHKNFEQGKGSCIACHKIGNSGRPIGPDLSKIGAIRTERDLLESIIFPSNTLARDYEAHVIETSDGQSTTGVIKSHTAEGLLLTDIAGQEKTIPHGSIIANTTLTTSLMPMGLDGTLTEQELCDLVAWLRSLK